MLLDYLKIFAYVYRKSYGMQSFQDGILPGTIYVKGLKKILKLAISFIFLGHTWVNAPTVGLRQFRTVVMQESKI